MKCREFGVFTMGNNSVNPYEPPQLTSMELRQNATNGFARSIARFLGMAALGYVSFSGVAAVYWALSDVLDVDANRSWALSIGLVGAAIFLSTELLNTGAALRRPFVPRLAVAAAVFVATGVVTVIVSEQLGWRRQRRFDADPWWLRKALLELVLFYTTVLGVRVIWTRASPAESPLRQT